LDGRDFLTVAMMSKESKARSAAKAGVIGDGRVDWVTRISRRATKFTPLTTRPWDIKAG